MSYKGGVHNIFFIIIKYTHIVRCLQFVGVLMCGSCCAKKLCVFVCLHLGSTLSTLFKVEKLCDDFSFFFLFFCVISYWYCMIGLK